MCTYVKFDQLKQDLADVAFTIPTPFTKSGEEVYHEKLEEHVKALNNAGGNLFIPCGNTGEYYSLTNQERMDVTETTVRAASKSSTIVAGAGGSEKTVRNLIPQYERAGVDAAMIMHPVHTYIHEQGLLNYYRSIAESTDLGIVIYKRGHDVADETLLDLVKIENVVGVKYAVNDIKAFAEVAERGADDAVWMNGIAERFAPSFALEGAVGFTTGIGNFVPRPVLELMGAVEDDDWKRAKEIRDVLLPYEKLRDESGENNSLDAANNVPAVKHGMKMAGLYGGPTRPPLVELSETDKVRAEEYYDRMKRIELQEAD